LISLLSFFFETLLSFPSGT